MALLEQLPGETLRERSIPALETERLVLRAPRLEDVNAIAALANDRRVAEMTSRIPHPYGRADAEQFIAHANTNDSATAFVIILADGTLIGGCGLGVTGGDAPEIGYWLGVPFWGRGYATEAARAVIDHAFIDRGCDVMLGGARVSNPASRRVLEKCGFQWTGVELRRVRAIASSAPVDRFRLDRGLWASLKSWGAAPLANRREP
jgi:RimJ/RimL family protein N-acetyltransferase